MARTLAAELMPSIVAMTERPGAIRLLAATDASATTQGIRSSFATAGPSQSGAL